MGNQLSPTAQRNPTSGKKGSPGQELFRKGVWDSLRFKEHTFMISNTDHAPWSVNLSKPRHGLLVEKCLRNIDVQWTVRS